MQKDIITVCMLSCRHGLMDDRIYKKEALTLSKNGYKVTHIAYGDENKDFYTEDKIRLIQIEKKKKGTTIKTKHEALKQAYLKDLFETAKELKADIYHLHDVDLCRIAMKLKKLPWSPKVIYDAHEPYFENLLDYWKKRSLAQVLFMNIPALWAEKRILNRIDFLIATEKNVASRFLQKNKNTSIVYNYSYFNPDDFMGDLNDKKYDLIYCGGIIEAKGIFQMIDAVCLAKKKGYELKMVLVGSLDTEPQIRHKIEQLVKKEKLEENLIFTGNLALDEISQYYAQSKIAFCLLPLNRTNQLILPIKLFEYAAFGLPIVGSDFGHVKDYIESNNVGVTVDPHNVEAVCDAVIDLLKNDKYKSYIKNGIECVKNKYRWSNQEAELLNIYEHVLRNT